MKATEAEYIEGPRVWQRFVNAMVKALTLSKPELDGRMAAQRRQSAMNPHKIGGGTVSNTIFGYLAIFLHENDAIIPKHINWNLPDWRHAPHVFLADPGPADREAWAKRFGESSWTVMGFDWGRDQVTMEKGRTQ